VGRWLHGLRMRERSTMMSAPMISLGRMFESFNGYLLIDLDAKPETSVSGRE